MGIVRADIALLLIISGCGGSTDARRPKSSRPPSLSTVAPSESAEELVSGSTPGYDDAEPVRLMVSEYPNLRTTIRLTHS
jgi:hypothetical protein